MGSQVEDQQVSCLWQGEHLLSVSLSGFINYLDVNNPSQPLRVLKASLSPPAFLPPPWLPSVAPASPSLPPSSFLPHLSTDLVSLFYRVRVPT